MDTDKDRSFYLVQELASGQSLASLVEQGWRSAEREIKNIARQVLVLRSRSAAGGDRSLGYYPDGLGAVKNS